MSHRSGEGAAILVAGGGPGDRGAPQLLHLSRDRGLALGSVTLKWWLWVRHVQSHPKRCSPCPPGSLFPRERPSGEAVRAQRGVCGGGQGQSWVLPRASRQPPGDPPRRRGPARRCGTEGQAAAGRETLEDRQEEAHGSSCCVLLLPARGSPGTPRAVLAQDAAESATARSAVLQQGWSPNRGSGGPQALLCRGGVSLCWGGSRVVPEAAAAPAPGSALPAVSSPL